MTTLLSKLFSSDEHLSLLHLSLPSTLIRINSSPGLTYTLIGVTPHLPTSPPTIK